MKPEPPQRESLHREFTMPRIELLVKGVIEFLPVPDMVLPLPDKTENYRKFMVRGRMITSPWVREYREKVSQQLLTKEAAMLNLSPPLIMLYKVYQTTRMRSDPHGYEKVITDAVFGSKADRFVCPWCMPGVFDSPEKKVHLWFISLHPEAAV